MSESRLILYGLFDSIRSERSLLDLIGLGTGPDTDPYLAKTNAACLEGDLAECFKSRALISLDEFFQKVNIKKNPATKQTYSMMYVFCMFVHPWSPQNWTDFDGTCIGRYPIYSRVTQDI